MHTAAKTLLLVAALTVAAPLIAQDLSGYEAVLYPLVTWPNDIVGVGGSRFSVNNKFLGVEGDVRIYPKYESEGRDGQVVWVPTVGVIPEGFPVTPFCCANSRLGRVLFVERGAETYVSATVTATSADSSSSITSLPVVREAGFKTKRTNILDIVSSYDYSQGEGELCRTAVPQFRHRLRIYDPDATGRGVVRVRVYDEGLYPVGPATMDVTVAIDGREGSDASYPSFVELPLQEICRPFSCHTPCWGGSQRIEIEPLTPGLRFWAFVSGTDNVNQRVVVNWPQ